jgi:hypothetical protein
VTTVAPATHVANTTSYSFVKWTVVGIGDQPNPFTMAITSNTTAVASYTAQVMRTLSVQSSPIQGVDITGTSPGNTNYSASLNSGTDVRLPRRRW